MENTDNVLKQAMDQAETSYEKVLLLEAFCQRFPAIRSETKSLRSELENKLSSFQSAQLQRTLTAQSGTAFELEVSQTIADYPEEVKNAIRSELYARPASLSKSKSDTNFEVWYTDDSTTYAADAVTEAYATQILGYMANSYKTMITDWGYKAGQSQTESGGAAAAKYQVWIFDIGSAYGATFDFEKNPSGSTTVCRTWSKIKIDKGVSPDDLLLSTCAHEYHHATELSYMDFSGFKLWILEASTAWIEYQVRKEYSSVTGTGSWDLFKARVDWHQARPNTSLDSTGTTVTDDYDSALFFWFLCNNQQISGASRTINLNFWKAMDTNNDWSKIFDSFNTALASLGTDYNTFDKIFPYYNEANYAVDIWYPKTIDDVKIENSSSPHTLDYSTSTSHKVDDQNSTVGKLAAKYYKFVPGDTLTDPTNMTVHVTRPSASDTKTNALVVQRKKDGSTVTFEFTYDTDGKGTAGVSDFSSTTTKEVVLILANSTEDASKSFVYSAELMKGFVFAIDDTGSMADEIAAARIAAKSVLAANKAAGIKRIYTLLTFKDGEPSFRGQSDNEDYMSTLIDGVGASGGSGYPESSLLTVRRGAEWSSNSDIMLMTDAASNSYGVDNTYADWGEVIYTLNILEKYNCTAHVIYVSGYSSSMRMVDNDGAPVNQSNYELNSSYSDEGYKYLSDGTGGLFIETNTSGVETASEVILNSTNVNTTIVCFDAGDSSTSKDYSYTIPVGSDFTNLVLNLNGATSSSLTMTVKNPSGTTVTNDTTDVTVSSVSDTVSYSISSSAFTTGNWTVDISGTGTFTFKATGSTSNPMTYTGETNVGKGGALSMSASFDSATDGLTFELLSLDGSSSIPVTLSSGDSGLTYTGTVTVDSVDSYRFRATKSEFSRMSSASINVSAVSVTAPFDTYGADAGDEISAKFTVTNSGSESVSLTISTSNTQGWADTSGVPTSLDLAAGESSDITIPITVDGGASNGDTETLTLQAVDASDPSVSDSGVAKVVVTSDRYLNMASSPAGASQSISPSVGAHQVEAGASQSISVSPAEGFEFTGWSASPDSAASIADSSSASTTVTISDNATVTANFSKIQVELTMTTNSSVGGSITPAAGTQTVNYGEATNITASPVTGFEFAGWTADPSESATIADAAATSTTVILKASATVTATFNLSAEYYALTTAITPENSGTTSAASPTATLGSAITITATAADGYKFLSWSASPEDSGSISKYSESSSSFTGSASTTYTALATFVDENATTYTLDTTVYPENSGSVSPVATARNYLAGDKVTIGATPASGYAFAGWRVKGASIVDDPDNASATLTILANTTLTAVFVNSSIEIDKFKMTVDSLKPENGSLMVSKATAPEGLEDPSTANISLVFDYWSYTCDDGTWKNDKYVSSSKEPKVVLGFKKDLWTLKVAKAELAGLVGGNAGGVNVLLNANSKAYGLFLECDLKAQWKYQGKKDEAPTDVSSADYPETGLTTMTKFNFGEKSKVSGKLDSLKPEKSNIVLGGIEVEIDPTDTNFDPTSCALYIEKVDTITFELTRKNEKKNLYMYTSKSPKMQVKLDLDKGYLSIKVNTDLSNITLGDGITVMFKCGKLIGGQIVPVNYKMTYMKK
jgi:hypothetical protein